jgi:hypothetical protein
MLRVLAEKLAAEAQPGGSDALFGKISGGAQAASTGAWALLPVCLALFILHEQARSAREGSALSFTEILGKTIIILILLSGYGYLCSLIVGVAQFGGRWMASEHLLDSLRQSVGTLLAAAQKVDFSFTELPKLILLELVVGIVLLSCLFAYVCGLLLSLVQNVYLVILLSLGKLSITVSLVPGIHLGKSWARSLAQTAAWSTVAGVITQLLAYRSFGQLTSVLNQGVGLDAVHVLPMLKVSAELVILGLSMLAVPLIVSRIFSGASPAGAALGAAFTTLAVWRFASSGLGALRGKSALASGDSLDGGKWPIGASKASSVRANSADDGPTRFAGKVDIARPEKAATRGQEPLAPVSGSVRGVADDAFPSAETRRLAPDMGVAAAKQRRLPTPPAKLPLPRHLLPSMPVTPNKRAFIHEVQGGQGMVASRVPPAPSASEHGTAEVAGGDPTESDETAK